MKKFIYSLCFVTAALSACNDDIDLVIPHATNITFEELKLQQRFSHAIPDGGFSCDGLKFNTVKSGSQLAAGFCYSNRNDRSFVWNNDEVSMDSIRYSIKTTRPNFTGTYLVCHVNGDDAFFTLDKPRVIDYLLVGNTTWTWLCMTYGDSFTGANPAIPSAPKGTWYTYVPGGVKKFNTGDYFTITAKGFKGNQQTATTSFDLACKTGHNSDNPTWNYIVIDWMKWDLSVLGEVDKVVFYLDSSDKDENGKMRTPAWFCIDGIQLKQ